MTSLMLFSISSPIVQHVYAEDDNTTSSVNKDNQEDNTDSSSSSNYKNLMVPSILSTAYADGLKAAASSASDSSNSDDKAYEKFYANVNNILAYQNDNGQHVFSNVGTLFGQVGMSSGSSTNDIASLSSVTKKELDSRFSVGNDKLGLAYLNFGNAYTNLVSHAEKRGTSSLGSESVVTGLTAASGQVANIGVSILKMFSPAPIIMAFRDSSVITDSKYDDNKLIKLVRETDLLGNIVRFFGDPAPGFPMISTADMIVVSIIMFTIGLSLLSIFMNGRQFGMTVRKIMVKILVVAVALPLSARLFDFGIGLLSDTASKQANSADAKIVSTNLLLGPWANVTKFGLPDGTTLNVRNGEFTLTSTDIYNINMYVAEKAGVISNETGADADKKVARYIKSAVTADKNETTIGWTNLIRSHTNTPWKTDKLLQVADTLGGNEDINKDVKIGDIGYLTEGGLISTPDGTQFSQSGVSSYGFGMTPIAAFNIINTTFDNDKLSVKSNLVNNLTVPTVAVGANTYLYSDSKDDAQTNRTMSPIIKMILNLVMLFAALKALAFIFSAGFGGVLHGGSASAFGSAAGFGELVGAVIALIGGVLGLSFLITIVNGIIDSVWNLLMSAIGIGKDFTIDDVLSPDFVDSIGGIPFIGGPLVEAMASVLNFLLSLLSLFVLPSLIKIPIEAFGSWISGLPGHLSEKAQAMENKFTGDYRAGGSSRGNHMANAAAKAAAKSRAQGKAVKTGLSMLGGAALNHMLSNNSESSVTGDTNNNNEDKHKDGLTPPTASVTEEPEGENAINSAPDAKDSDAITEATEAVDGDVVEENESVESSNLEGNNEENESQESIEDSDNFESINAGDVETSEVQDVSNENPVEADASNSVAGDVSDDKAVTGDAESVIGGANETPVEADASNSVAGDASDDKAVTGGALNEATKTGAAASVIGGTSETPVGADASNSVAGGVPDDESVTGEATEAGAASGEATAAGAAPVIEATSEHSVTDASKTGDSLQSDNSSQSVQASSKHDSVTQDGNQLDTSTTIEGGQEVNSSNSLASSVEALNKADANVDASQVSSDKSVTSQGGADNRSKMESKMTSSMSQSSKAINAGDKTTNNASITSTKSDRSPSNAKRAQASSRASRLVESVKNNSVLQNITGAAKGEVTPKEQAAMGAAHIAAGVIGAQGITQHGVDNLNQRQGKTSNKETSQVSSGQSVASQGGTDNRSKMESKMVSSSLSNTKRAQVSSRASRLVESVKSNSVLQNIAGTAKGEVTPKEHAAMGATHIAAGIIGAQGVTQHGVDNLNRRQGMTSNKETTNVAQNRPTGSTSRKAYDEMLIRKQEKDDKAFRDRRQAVGGHPQRPQRETNTKNKLESTKTRKFFEKVSDTKTSTT